MKFLRPVMLLPAVLCVLFASNVQAQSVVAVIDIKKVFDEHAGFQDQLVKIKGEIQAFEVDFKQKIDNLRRKRELLEGTDSVYAKDSPKYNEEIGKIAREASDLEVQRKLKQKEILEREAAAYYDTYQQIVKAVSAFADANRISLVLRYDSEQIDRHSRPDVIKGVNRYVVFQRDRDLTNIIIRQMNGVARNN